MALGDLIAGGFGVVGAGIGAVGAGLAGGDGTEIGVGAVAGGVAGAMIPTGVEMLGQAIIDNTPKAAKAIASNARPVLEGIGTASIYAGDITAQAVATTGKTVAGLTVGASKLASDAFFEYDPVKHKNFTGVGLNKAGKIAALGIAGISSILGAFDTYNQSRAGVPSGGLVTSTPNINDYQRNAAETYGAGGDLVFALNRNRRG